MVLYNYWKYNSNYWLIAIMYYHFCYHTLLIITDQALNISIKPMSEVLFEGDSVTVTLKLTEWKPLYSYYIDVIPSIPVTFNGNKSVMMKMSYNVQYNVSVLSAHLCGENNITVFTQLFHYSEQLSIQLIHTNNNNNNNYYSIYYVCMQLVVEIQL